MEAKYKAIEVDRMLKKYRTLQKINENSRDTMKQRGVYLEQISRILQTYRPQINKIVYTALSKIIKKYQRRAAKRTGCQEEAII